MTTQPDTKSILEVECKVADARCEVAEDYGWLLGCAFGLLTWLALDCRNYVPAPWSWVAGIALGILVWRVAVRKYVKAHDFAWKRYEQFLQSQLATSDD
jgi:hypothetical protein